jgi:hypothetical protein
VADLSQLPPPPAGYTVSQDPSTLPPPPAGYTVTGGSPAVNVLDDPQNEYVGQSNGIPVYKHNHPEGAAGFGDAFWEGVGGKAVMDMMAGASRTKEGAEKTKETAKALIQGLAAEPGRVWGELSATGQAMLTGDLPGAAYHAAGSVPMVGAPAQQVAQDFSNGDYARGFGHALGMFLPFLWGAAKPALKGSIPSASALFESKLNPVEQSAADFLENRGVPLSPATKTGNRFLRSAEKIVHHSPLGAEAGEDFSRSTEQGLRRVAGELADEADFTPATPESVGRDVPAALKKNIDELGMNENAAYGRAWQGRDQAAYTEQVPVRTEQAPVLDEAGKPTGATTARPVLKAVNMPVDIRDIKALAEPIREEMDWALSHSEQSQSAAFNVLEKLLKSDDYIPAWQAERGLGALKTMARVSTESGVRNTSQGVAASLVPALQDGIDAAVAKTGEDSLRGLQQGRSLHANKMEVADIADQLRSEPVQNFNKLVWQQDTGIDFLRKINGQAPDLMPRIGRAYVDQLFDKATREGGFARARSILNDWQRLGPETKRLLFPNPLLRQSLDNFFKGAEMVGQTPNPSGTALVNHASSLNPLRILAGYAGSKILFTPSGAHALTQALRQASRGGAAATIAENALKRLAARSALSSASEKTDQR